MTSPLPIGAAVLDPVARTLTGPAGAARLTPQPMRLLLRLAVPVGQVVRHDALVASLHGRYGRADVKLVQAHMRYVRRALRDSGSGVVVRAIYGVGAGLDVLEPGADAREAA